MRGARLSAFAAALSLGLSSGAALAWTPAFGPPFVVWPKIPVLFYVNEATFPPELGPSAKENLLAGFAAWSAPGCTFFKADLVGDLPGGTFDAADDKNVLLWINRPDPWPMELGLVDSIIEKSKTPYAALHDIDANKPGGSIKIRVKTYAHALKLHQERLDDVALKKAELAHSIDQKRLELLRAKEDQLAARRQSDPELARQIDATAVERGTDRVEIVAKKSWIKHDGLRSRV